MAKKKNDVLYLYVVFFAFSMSILFLGFEKEMNKESINIKTQLVQR